MEAYVLTKDDVEFLRQALTNLRNTSVNPMQIPTDSQSYDQATATYLIITPVGGIARATAGTAANSLATPTYASCEVVQQNNVVQPPQLFTVPGFTLPVWNYDLQVDIGGSQVILVVQNSFGEWVPCISPTGSIAPGSGGAYIALTPAVTGIPAGFYLTDMGTGTGSGTGTGTGCIGEAESFTPGQATCSIFRIINAAYGSLRPVGISEVVFNLSLSAVAECSVILIVQDAFGRWIAVDPNQGGGSAPPVNQDQIAYGPTFTTDPYTSSPTFCYFDPERSAGSFLLLGGTGGPISPSGPPFLRTFYAPGASFDRNVVYIGPLAVAAGNTTTGDKVFSTFNSTGVNNILQYVFTEDVYYGGDGVSTFITEKWFNTNTGGTFPEAQVGFTPLGVQLPAIPASAILAMSASPSGLFNFPVIEAVTPQDVTGSRLSGAALVSLLAALVALGLITDSTSP